ncbi:hypothetical protein, partial [Sansalvadorimonas verongulae]|uniref:hypothetical protein n=1 Tax=Sansalvadorimonas verongulae TaxID=2172824 RepID=UPI001E608AED
MDITPNYGKGSQSRQTHPPFRPSYSSGPKLYVHRKQGSPASGSANNSERRQLPQRCSQHYPAQSHVKTYPDIDNAFTLLKTNPKSALDEAETLFKKYEGDSQRYARVVQLKARSLFLLENFKGCIEYVESLSRGLQNNKGVMMAKGRALQARGHLM